MNPNRLVAVAAKEFHHILRDGQTLFIIVSLPVVMMFMFGYALKSEIEDAPIVLIDPHPSPASRILAQALEANSQFHVVEVVAAGDPEKILVRTRARAIIRIDADYEKNITEGGAQVSVLLDGSDPAMATTLRYAIPGFFHAHIAQALQQKVPEVVHVDTRFLYNPEQKSALFFVPGLMATILIMIGALLTSVTVTREKESGTLSNLRISNLHAGEIILGKLTPYFVIASVSGFFILLVGRLVFDVHIRGNSGFLACSTALYLLVALGIGLLISTVVQKQQHAMLMSLGLTMMPTIMLSGFVFPLASLPYPLQILSKIIPATWYLQIVRGVVLKAASWNDLWFCALVLGVMAVVLLVLASARFSREH